MAKKRIVVLISGGGSNLQALIDGCSNKSINADIAAVISNRPNAYGLQRAADAGIVANDIDHKQFGSREKFDEALRDMVKAHKPDLVILAGFMRILTPVFLTEFNGILLNIHPSLLPKYAGLNTHQRALDAGDCEHGVTVHFVTEELDGGPPIIQAAVPIETNDNADSLAKRVLEKEHVIYPIATQWFIDDRLVLKNNAAWLDGKALPPSGFLYTDDL